GGCGDSIVLYEWDLDDDGVFDDASGATPALPWTSVDALGLGITDPLTHLPTHPVGLRVTDSLGKTGIADTTLRVYRNAPEASFGANPNPAACGQDVTFDGSGSRHGHPGRTITRYEWDLDGDSVFEVSGTSMTVVSHAFSAFGSYDVTLRVTDDNVPAKTDTAMVTVVVDQGNRPPVADAGGPYVVEEDQMLELDGSGSSDPDGGCGDSIVKYEWDLNDDAVFDDALGATPTVFWADLEALGLAPANVATGLPTHTVRLRTTDSLGLVHVATAVLTMYEFEWLFPMTVSGGSVSELAFGMAVGATDGSDDVLDQPVSERSRDALPETIFSGRDGVALWRDVRGVSDCALWLMEVQAAADNDCVLSWSAGSVPGAGLRLVETDETGEVLPDGVQLDMAVRETVTILAGEMQFFLIVHGQYERTITLAIGWNLISFPFNLWVPDLVEVLGDLPILLPVWEWTGRQYAPMSGGDRFQPKRGYWVYVAPATGVAEELVATGFPCWDETGAVTPGAWNLVGALEECAEPVSARNGMALWHWQADARSYAKISDDGVVPVAKGLWLFFADSGGQQLIDFTTFEFVLSAK
ncbi:MAG: PKD domain-containing protein, partial [Lentisphaeria bacterium]|nr:PKD domain-containing protein [Lentisphaeria bacterium]